MLQRIDVKCVKTPDRGTFYEGFSYTLNENRMNDIVWFTVNDSKGKEQSFHEYSWTKYFERL